MNCCPLCESDDCQCERSLYAFISKENADRLWPEGWTEEGIKKKGWLLDKPIDPQPDENWTLRDAVEEWD